MLLRLPVVLAVFALPTFGIARLGQALADRWGTAIGREAAGVAAFLTPVHAPSVSAEDSALSAQLEASEALALAAPPPASEPKPKGPAGRKAGKRAVAPKRVGVFVSAATVLRLSQAQVMPRGVAVGPLGARPAGLRLIGVAGLGIGMRDGDVLTRVLGAPVSATSEVVSRVIAARARRAREISGEFWRDGAPCSIVVEQPYIDAPPPAPAAPAPSSAAPAPRP